MDNLQPSVHELYAISAKEMFYNCLYSSIAHAIFTLNNPFFSYTQSWDGQNYCFHYGSSRGTITFQMEDDLFSGAARDESSNRRRWYPAFQAIQLFAQAPDQIKSMAKLDTLEYLYDEEGGVTQPIATVGFWNTKGTICSCDLISDFESNGGEYIRILTNTKDAIIAYWNEQYRFSCEEEELVDSLFQEAIQGRRVNIKKYKQISKACEGYYDCIDSLKEIGLIND